MLRPGNKKRKVEGNIMNPSVSSQPFQSQGHSNAELSDLEVFPIVMQLDVLSIGNVSKEEHLKCDPTGVCEWKNCVRN